MTISHTWQFIGILLTGMVLGGWLTAKIIIHWGYRYVVKGMIKTLRELGYEIRDTKTGMLLSDEMELHL